MAVTTKETPSGEELARTLESLVDYAATHGLLATQDRVWAYNALLEDVGLTGPGPREGWALAEASADPTFDLDAALAELAEAAVGAGTADDTLSGRDRAALRAMGTLMPRPSEVAARFGELATAEGPRAATDWFYQLCCDAGYVRRSAIARNVQWVTPTRWGNLEITINLSKPEKDPREIAAAGAAPASGDVYPACQLCIENEGYPGRGAAEAHGAHPARQNLRIVPIELGGERWGLQYSPYAYFNEHCIAMSAHHRPMHIDHAALTCLLDFVDLLPHYFIGSNADLPVVGGSILSHDHFQGGAHEFPMMRAEVEERFSLPGFDGVTGEVLVRPLSVLRLRAGSREALLSAADHVIGAWRAWTDESVGVVAQTADGVRHNTVTPVVRRNADGYEAYLALRCNIASAEHPLGVFHPHAQWHHIKRENIGLIEVMGLAILPARLVGELAAVRHELVAEAAGARDADGLVARLEADPMAAPHAAWACDVFSRRADELVDDDTAREVLRDEVGHVFGHVLEDAGVFKWDDAGRAALRRFLGSL